MRAVLLCVTVLVQAGATALPVIEKGKVGPVQLGLIADVVRDHFPPERRELVDLNSEGDLTPALFLRFPGLTQRDGVIAVLGVGLNDLVVRAIEVHDPALKTAKGIHAGSTMGEVRKAYRLGELIHGEGRYSVLLPELSGRVYLDASGSSGASLRQARSVSDVADAVRVAAIGLQQGLPNKPLQPTSGAKSDAK